MQLELSMLVAGGDAGRGLEGHGKEFGLFGLILFESNFKITEKL
jgi:hypothetical protein